MSRRESVVNEIKNIYGHRAMHFWQTGNQMDAKRRIESKIKPASRPNGAHLICAKRVNQLLEGARSKMVV